MKTIGHIHARHERLNIELIELDAARYRWLRERDLDTIENGGVFAGMTPENLVLSGKDLDKAIDEAMKLPPN